MQHNTVLMFCQPCITHFKLQSDVPEAIPGSLGSSICLLDVQAINGALRDELSLWNGKKRFTIATGREIHLCT